MRNSDVSVTELQERADTRSAEPSVLAEPGSVPRPSGWLSPRARRLAVVAATVVTVDWTSKAIAWRRLPGSAVINTDTSGAVPILPGLISQPVLGAVVDAAALSLLVVSALWLVGASRLTRSLWLGCALIWAGVGSNAADRWFGHLLLAPGSARGVVDWIGLDRASINLADVVIGVGIVLSIAALAVSRLPSRARVAVAACLALLVPMSILTASGTSSNAAPAVSTPTYVQRVRSMLWVGSDHGQGRVVWRDGRKTMGWNLTVEAVDRNGRQLERWRVPWSSDISSLPLPRQTWAVYVTLDSTGWTMTLADNLS